MKLFIFYFSYLHQISFTPSLDVALLFVFLLVNNLVFASRCETIVDIVQDSVTNLVLKHEKKKNHYFITFITKFD